LTFSEYDECSQEARDLRRDYTDARDAITKNSDLTSKQKYSKKQNPRQFYVGRDFSFPISYSIEPTILFMSPSESTIMVFVLLGAT